MKKSNANYLASVFWVFGYGAFAFVMLKFLGVIGDNPDPASFIIMGFGIGSLSAANWIKAQVAKTNPNGDEERSKPAD
ncbi:hypothetical protein NZK35_20955 [Stieleria sp. ICT_E10.1]|uniref:hypothetical protein n=1 Tax=Stieleria sedimenti TaxID=2976331 RepID=UPI00217F667D|nr:hypothetical protein [Stieleria sedimenti]MCS7469130.1 hypothetical protein [Stieleria sedimenti]